MALQPLADHNLGYGAPATFSVSITTVASTVSALLITAGMSQANVDKVLAVRIARVLVDGLTSRGAVLVGDSTGQNWPFPANETCDPLTLGTAWYVKSLAGTLTTCALIALPATP